MEEEILCSHPKKSEINLCEFIISTRCQKSNTIPRIVVEEIAEARGLLYDKSKLSSDSAYERAVRFEALALYQEEKNIFPECLYCYCTEKISLSKLERTDIKLLGRKINPSVKEWTHLGLKQSIYQDSQGMNTVWNCMVSKNPTSQKNLLELLMKSSHCLGKKTPENPKLLDSRFLFLAVYANNLQHLLSSESTLREMFSISVIGLSDPNISSKFVAHRIEKLPQCEPVPRGGNLLLQSANSFKLAIPWTTNKPEISRVLCPTTQEEAVVFAAAIFRFDLTKFSSCAVCEYYHLAASVIANSPSFTPMTFEKEYLRSSPKAFDMNVSFVKEGNLSLNCLSDKDLLKLAIESSGFNLKHTGFIGLESPASAVEDNSQNPSSLAFSNAIGALDYAYDKLSVFEGIHPWARNVVSPISLDEISPQDESFILSFGIESTHKFVAYTMSDVISSFSNYRSFVISIEDEMVYLSFRLINLLKSYCERNQLSENHQSLRAAIRICETRNLCVNTHAQEMEQAIRNESAQVKTETVEALERLLQLGMYMRGWKVSDATKNGSRYPLASIETTFAEGNQYEVDIYVTEALNLYETAVSNISSHVVRQFVRSSPLLRKIVTADTLVRFVPTLTEEQGYTIEDRVAIIRTGEAGSVFSCMRMSSNFIVASAYYYLASSLGVDPGFDLSKMSEIF
jgi:hypothetical protein